MTKQPYEEYMVGIDFTKDLEVNDETIVLGSSTVLAQDKNGDDAASEILGGGLSLTTNPDNPNAKADATLQIKLIAGTVALSPYSLSFRIQTDTGQKFEGDMKIKIRELLQ